MANDDDKAAKSASVSQDDGEFHHWHIPDVTQQIPADTLNAFGRRDAVREVVGEPEAIKPPTLAEIEQIRAEAEQAGFTEGAEKGHAEGLEQGRLTGLEEGHQQGFEQGKEQGLQEGLNQASQLIEQFNHIIEQFAAPLSLLDTEIELEMVNLSRALARSVIGHELHTHPEHVLAALRHGVDSLPIKDQNINIRLHPDDLAIVNTLYEQAQLDKNRWQLEADPSLSAGDCVIDSQRSSVDMRLQTRMDSVLSDVDGHLERLQKEQQAKLDALAKPSAEQHDAEVNHTETTAQEPMPAEQTEVDQAGVEPVSAESATTDTVENPDESPSA
ncbi:flagellar assembly protein FliH [Shewanella waksmanii]|uniref:flagellar assembly protein FliH n=1 Tax=Shewanella waksmanii TaxID=213783 RepID=UPI0004B8266E|nr:flagellar assembly protein FliH [Shewanella waksmanii]